jgi:ribosomal protein L29
MKKDTLHTKTPEALMEELKTLKASVAKATFGRSLGKQGDLKTYRAEKKMIARILTLLNAKQ